MVVLSEAHTNDDIAFPLDELKPISCTGQGPDWKDPYVPSSQPTIL